MRHWASSEDRPAAPAYGVAAAFTQLQLNDAAHESWSWRSVRRRTPAGRHGFGVSRRQNALDPGFHGVPAGPAHPDRDADGGRGGRGGRGWRGGARWAWRGEYI